MELPGTGARLLTIGQTTVDHVVPGTPGAWRPQLGGNALYAAAGARLWAANAALTVLPVTRLGQGCLDPFPALWRARLDVRGVRRVVAEHLVCWILYERDGRRRSLARNPAFLPLPLTSAAGLRAYGRMYRRSLLALSPAARDIPRDALPCAAAHLAPQLLLRHRATLRWLRRRAPNSVLSLDPSPTYLGGEAGRRALLELLPLVDVFLPSREEATLALGEHLPTEATPDGWLPALRAWAALGPRVVGVKLGAEGSLLFDRRSGRLHRIAAPPAAVADTTGAGDAYAGAFLAGYLATRGDVGQAGQMAAVAAAMVIETRGADAALALEPAVAARRLAAPGAPEVTDRARTAVPGQRGA